MERFSIIRFERLVADLTTIVDCGDRPSPDQLKLDQVICIRNHYAVRVNDLNGNK